MTSASAALLAASAVALGHAIQLNNGFYGAGPLAWLTVAFACAIAAAGVQKPRAGDRRFRVLTTIVLAAGLAWQFAALMTARPAMYIKFRHPADRPFLFYGLALAAVLSIGVVAGPYRVRRAAFGGAILVFVLLGGFMLRASPNPAIDVVTVHREAIRAFLDGRSPYSVTFPNIYDGTQFYAPDMVVGGRVRFGLPYPPVSLLMAAPGAILAGDYRYALLAALVATAGLVGWMAFGTCRGDGLAQRNATLAVLALLFTPRIFFQLEQGWTEPFMVVLLAAAAIATVHGATRTGPVLTGLFFASKQYLVLVAPLLWLLFGRCAWRRALVAVTIAAAITVPFFIWDPRGFLRSVVLLQFAEPFRTDSLGYLSWIRRHGFGEPPLWITLLASAFAVALSLWRLPPTPSGFCAGTALVSIATFAFGKKAFCNYYFFVIAGLLLAVMLSETERARIDQGSASPHPRADAAAPGSPAS